MNLLKKHLCTRVVTTLIMMLTAIATAWADDDTSVYDLDNLGTATVSQDGITFSDCDLLPTGFLFELDEDDVETYGLQTGNEFTQEYTFYPATGVQIDACVTAQIVAGDSVVITGNRATKLTFFNVPWKANTPLLDHWKTAANVSFVGADVDVSRIVFININSLQANSQMTLVSHFGLHFGTITGTSYSLANGFEGEGYAALIEDSALQYRITTEAVAQQQGLTFTVVPSDPSGGYIVRDDQIDSRFRVFANPGYTLSKVEWSGQGITLQELYGEATMDDNFYTIPSLAANIIVTFTKNTDQVRVHFKMNDHGSAVPNQDKKLGEKVDRPDDPTEDNYAFVGWYMDSGFKKPYDFDAPLDSTLKYYPAYSAYQLNLYARWQPISGTCGRVSEKESLDGTQVTWAVSKSANSNDYDVLTIGGKGDMKDFLSEKYVPWYSLAGSIKTVILPDKLTNIGKFAFKGCTGLTEITLPDSVRNIGKYAFKGCTGLTEIILPDSVTSIGDCVFENCTSLAKVTINGNVKKINKTSFNGCTALTTLVFSEGVTTIYSGYKNCDSLKSVTIPASVTTISKYAFDGCKYLTTVTIAENSQLQTIDASAFRNCVALPGFTIPAGVTKINSYAFDNCDALTEMTIPASVTSIGPAIFRYCDSLKAIHVDPNNPAYMSDNGILFDKAQTTLIEYLKSNSTTRYTIPASVTYIRNEAFIDCNNLTEITIPAIVTKIGNYAFQDCGKLAKVTIFAPSQEFYGYWAFHNNAPGRIIYVPSNYVDEYKSNWEDYAESIVGFDGIDLIESDDNNPLIHNAEGGTLDVTLSDRILYKNGNWNTICLPFDVTIADSPLAGATAKTLASATMTGTRVTLTFGSPVTKLTAGVPYIIKWDRPQNYEAFNGNNLMDCSDIVNPTFTNVTIKASQSTVMGAKGHVQFIGYYDPITIDENDTGIYYMTAGNTLKHTGIARTLKPCRAYFHFSEAAAARQVVMDFGDDEATGINSMDNGQWTIHNSQLNNSQFTIHNGWYDLQGRKLSGEPTKKGIYILDGKKVKL